MSKTKKRRKRRTYLHPAEILVWYVIPAIRRELTRTMIDKGIAQKDIARMLGVTEPAVTQYKLKKSKRSRGDQVEIDEEMKGEIEKSAETIIGAWRNKQEDEFVYQEMTREVNRIIDLLRDRGDLCEIHREYCAHIKEDCSACKDL